MDASPIALYSLGMPTGIPAQFTYTYFPSRLKYLFLLGTMGLLFLPRGSAGPLSIPSGSILRESVKITGAPTPPNMVQECVIRPFLGHNTRIYQLLLMFLFQPDSRFSS